MGIDPSQYVTGEASRTPEGVAACKHGCAEGFLYDPRVDGNVVECPCCKGDPGHHSRPSSASSSSAGICQQCGTTVEKRYGGEGRYPVVCLDCWVGPAHSDRGCESTQGGLCERHAMEVHSA